MLQGVAEWGASNSCVPNTVIEAAETNVFLQLCVKITCKRDATDGCQENCSLFWCYLFTSKAQPFTCSFFYCIQGISMLHIRWYPFPEYRNSDLPMPVPARLCCDAFKPRLFFDTSPKSHPSPYLHNPHIIIMEARDTMIYCNLQRLPGH